jgi:nucleotide-binding universal stress UspA family protein
MTAHHVVVGYDGSESSKLALTFGLREARKRGCPLQIAHVGLAGISTVGASPVSAVTSHDKLMVAERALVQAAEDEAREEAPGVDVMSRIVTGPPARALLELLDEAELVVVGSRGLGSFAALMVGSTSRQLAAHAPCPVVVVRSTGYLPLGAEAGRVVVGVDGSNGSERAVAFAFEEAALRHCGLTAISAWEVPSFEAYGWMTAPTTEDILPVYEHEARRMLAEGLAGWGEKYPEVEVRRISVHGNPVAELVNASAGAQLVVVGSRGAGGFRSLLLGSVSDAVLRHAHSAVAVIPHGSADQAAGISAGAEK